VADLEKRLNAIESIPIVAMGLKLNPHFSPANEFTPQKDAPLELVEWSCSLSKDQQDCENCYEILYVLKNRTDKDIKLVEGIMVFRDLLGQEILRIRLWPDVFCYAGKTAHTGGLWRPNKFNPYETRLQVLKHDDVKADILISKVAFDDNSIWSADEHR
jgi:hypothetical protein